MDTETTELATSTSQICFFICPVGQPNSDTRSRADLVEEYLVAPAADDLHFTIVRADKIGQSGMITTQVVEYIESAEMMIADLSEANANVFYELALRHALRKPVVLLVERASVPFIPFDVIGARVIIYDLKDWTSPGKCVQELIEQMRAPVGPNPISTALDHLVIPKGVDTSITDVLKSLQQQMQTLSVQVSNLPIQEDRLAAGISKLMSTSDKSLKLGDLLYAVDPKLSKMLTNNPEIVISSDGAISMLVNSVEKVQHKVAGKPGAGQSSR